MEQGGASGARAFCVPRRRVRARASCARERLARATDNVNFERLPFGPLDGDDKVGDGERADLIISEGEIRGPRPGISSLQAKRSAGTLAELVDEGIHVPPLHLCLRKEKGDEGFRSSVSGGWGEESSTVDVGCKAESWHASDTTPFAVRWSPQVYESAVPVGATPDGVEPEAALGSMAPPSLASLRACSNECQQTCWAAREGADRGTRSLSLRLTGIPRSILSPACFFSCRQHGSTLPLRRATPASVNPCLVVIDGLPALS
eukprot:6195769-Pleurochrysis_carterae.AAC.2